MNIILLSGKQGSGKTSTADDLAHVLTAEGVPKEVKMGEWTAHQNSTVLRTRFAQPLYEMHDAVLKVLASYGVTRPDLVKDGPLLQLLGTEWGRKTIDENIWVNLAKNKIEAAGLDFVVIDDARFENEFNAFSSDVCLKVRLGAPVEVRKERCEMWRDSTDHPSEVGLDDYSGSNKFDLYLDTHLVSKEENLSKIITAIKERGWL